MEVFIAYFDKWKSSVESRAQEGYEQVDLNKMQLSAETLFGLRMTGR